MSTVPRLRPRPIWPLLGLGLGALAGFAYWYGWGCTTGCPGQSNPAMTIGLGAAAGLVLGVSGSR